MYIMLEVVPYGDLQQFLANYQILNEKSAVFRFAQRLNGTLCLHKKKITHRTTSQITCRLPTRILQASRSNFPTTSARSVLASPVGVHPSTMLHWRSLPRDRNPWQHPFFRLYTALCLWPLSNSKLVPKTLVASLLRHCLPDGGQL